MSTSFARCWHGDIPRGKDTTTSRGAENNSSPEDTGSNEWSSDRLQGSCDHSKPPTVC